MESQIDLDYYKGYLVSQSGPRLVIPSPVLQLNNVPLAPQSDLDYYRSYLAKI